MKKRILSIALVLCILITVLPITPLFAVAATTTVTSATVGAFTITGGVQDTDYTYDSDVLTVKSATALTIQNTDPDTATTDRIKVESGVSANLTLAGVNIDVSGDDNACAFEIAKDTTGNVTLTLADNTQNILASGKRRAGLEKEGTAGKLTIQCEHSGHTCDTSCGKLTASSTDGAGIGSGIAFGNSGNVSNITITGGSIKASGKTAIGKGDGTAVTPTDGNGNKVYLEGHSMNNPLGYGIENPNGYALMIDGVVYPTGHTYYDFDAAEWKTEKTVYPYLSSNSHTQFFGTDKTVGTLITRLDNDRMAFTVTYTADGTLAVHGEDYFYDQNDNGKLYIVTDRALTIKNKATSTATADLIVVPKCVSANLTLAGVNIDVSLDGMEEFCAFEIAANTTGNVTLTLADNSNNILKSGSSHAGLEKEGISGSLTIQCAHSGESGHVCGTTCGKLTTSSNDSAAGIGSGCAGGFSGDVSNITITGGYVIASSTGGAGIGSGFASRLSGDVSNITISGGCVTASSTDGAGIGSGCASFYSGDVSNITITGGSIKAGGKTAIGKGDGTAVTPTDGNGNNVYLYTINNPDGKAVTVNGIAYPKAHTYYDGTAWTSETNVYPYVPHSLLTVTVGDTTTEMFYNSDEEQFEKATYTVTYAAGQYGTGSAKPDTKFSGVPLTLNDVSFTRTGYTQTGWATTDGGAKVYDLGGKYTANAPVTLYPVWTDVTAPVISGITNGETYCESQTVTVSDNDGIASVTVNGTPVTPDNKGKLTLSPAEGTQKIVVTDKAGNKAEMTVTVNDGHTYEWKTENGQYWQKCKFCGDKTDKKDIPTITVNGADKVCVTQDYAFAVTVPEGATDVTYDYDFANKGDSGIAMDYDNGIYSATIACDEFENETSFVVSVVFTTADGYTVSTSKTVQILSEHTGGTATCTEKAKCEVCGEPYGEVNPDNHTDEKEWSTKNETQHEQKWKCCGEAVVSLENHEWKDGVCEECGYVCQHADITPKDHICDVCGKTVSEHTYEWQSENGQYWQKCSYCGDETAKKDIPTITVNGADKVCITQDYTFSFTLPEGVTVPKATYYPEESDRVLSVTENDGVYTATVSHTEYRANSTVTCFFVNVYAKTVDGFEFYVSKQVIFQSEHIGGTATCTEKAKCDVCGEEYGEINADNHTTLKHVESKAATTEAEGNAEYWHCEDCNKYFSDENGKNEIKLSDTVIAKLIKTDDDNKSPQTGDNSHMALWFVLLFVSGGALVGTGLYGRKKKCFVK